MQEAITYNHLKLSTFDLTYIKELKVESSINHHSTLKLMGIVYEENEDSDIHVAPHTPIELYYTGEEGKKTIFWGIITKLKIKSFAEYYEIFIEAKSFSYLMDIQRKSRSFQDKNMTLHGLVNQITKEYAKSDCIVNVYDEPLERLWVQYNETDWEFIKRLASYYNSGLFPEITLEGIRYFLATPVMALDTIDMHEYTVTKRLDDYESMKENELESLNETDFITYTIKSFDLLKLGAHFVLAGQPFYISSAIHELKEGILESSYEASLKKGHKKKRIWPEAIRGISLEGTVIEVKEDEIKVKLDIDDKQDKAKAYWFKYSTIAASPDGSGWYFMPEIEDRVRVNFPTADEKDAFALSCIYNIIADPDIKHIATIYDKEIVFSKDSITISANNQSRITLTKDGNISITGNNNININAGENISMRAGNDIILSSKGNVDITCDKGGKVLLTDGGDIKVKGTKVRIN